jgi:histidinol-phosphate aminotransferase
MSGLLDLARADLRELRPYTPGVYEPEYTRLNANESPWRLPADTTERGLNVYPPPRPMQVRDALAAHYGLDEERILVTRGSSEAIDVLIRGFCAAGRDRIAITPPTFDMYRLYATIQGAEIVRVPLLAERGFAVDVPALCAAADSPIKLVFVCSPNNPTGASVPAEDMERICTAFAGKALVVIDEAYHEFSDRGDFTALAERHPHVVLLRTLSKFVSLAGTRCGALIAQPAVVEFLGNVLPPYTFPTPSIEHVLAALTPDSLRTARERVATIKRERGRLAEALADCPGVVEVCPSDANFVLIRTRDGDRFARAAHAGGILVRQFHGEPALTDCIRITVGRPEDNDRLLKAVSGVDGHDGD